MSLDILGTQPLPEAIESCLDSYHPTKPAHHLLLVTALLKYTVPQAYLHLPSKTKDSVASAFRSAVGLGNLIAKIASLSSAPDSPGLAPLLNCHLLLLHKVLAPQLTLCMCRTALELKEIDRLLFRGKCYSVVREADLKHHGLEIPPLLTSMAAYTAFLCRELGYLQRLVDVKASNGLILSLFSLSGELALLFFHSVFQRDNVALLRTAVGAMRRFERKMVLTKFFDFVATRFWNRGVALLDSLAAVYVLTNAYLDNSVWDILMLNPILSRYSYSLNHLAALSAHSGLSAADYERLVLGLLASWGSSGLISQEPVVRQENRTHLLICLCGQLAPEAVKSMVNHQDFVSAISNRLSSLSDRVKFLGVYFADSVCKMAGEPQIFDMEIPADLVLPDARLTAADVILNEEDAWDILASPQVVEPPSHDVVQLEHALRPVSIADDNMSDEEDDPTLNTAKPVLAPIYVRDILAYLTSDSSKDNQAYEKQKIALQTAPTLLRQKLHFGTEVAFFAEELMSMLVALPNQYDEPGFEAQRLNAMIAVVVSYPKITTHTCHLLLTGDYSLQQRICLLSCMSLAARELRGFEDESVRKAFKQTNFPTKQLPEKLHRQYLAADTSDYGYNSIEASIQNQLMSQASEDARDQIHGGKILRISLALTKKTGEISQPGNISHEALVQFRKTVGTSFFFPLVAVWYESGGINIGPYTPVLVAHFVRTLSIILHAAYPAAVNFHDMVGEYIALVCPLLEKVTPSELQLIESIVTGLLLIVDVCDGQFLIQNYNNQLSVVERTVAGWWEELIEDKVKSLCAGLLLKLGTLRTDMEKLILDNVNQGFF